MLHAFVLLLFSVFLPIERLHAESSHEHQTKAGSLLNFAPGTNLFGACLKKTVSSETVRGRLIIEHHKTVEEIQTCHILYIGQSEARRLQRVVGKVKGKPMLTISDVPGAADEGVAFVIERHRVKLHVNLEALKSASLTVSSKLLRMAQVVKF